MSTTIGILIFDDVEELDFVGPWEVFASAATQLPELTVCTLAEAAQPIRCAKGLTVTPDYALADAPGLDVLLVPGGQGTRREAHNEGLVRWIAETAGTCDWVTSVCTGSLLIHAAGLAKGKRITTHWAFVASLREIAVESQVLDDVRFVRDGSLVTAAGVSAGIDMALWLTGQIESPEFARQVQRGIQYEPAPPYSAEV
jgi:transcriptional regulator GlxA family with amidase domain